MWPLKTITYFVLFWVACIASLINPIWGIVNYMMAYQTNPPVAWWGKPLVETGMRFSMLAVAFTVVGLITGRRNVPTVKPALTFWEICVFGLIGLSMMTTIIGTGFGPVAQVAFEKFWKLQVFVLIMARLVTTRKNLNIVIWTLVVGSFYLGYDAYTAPSSAFEKGRLEIFGGPDISTSSGAAAHLAAMLPIIGIAFLIAKSWKGRVFAAIAGALTVNAVVLCRTRSAFLGILCGILVAFFMAPRAKRFRIHVLLLLGGILAFHLTDAHYWERISTLSSRAALSTDTAATSRLDIWIASTRILADHPFGIGLGNFTNLIGDYDYRYYLRSPHNTLVLCFTELGILGGLLFIAVILESMRMLYRSSRLAAFTRLPEETKYIVYGLLVSMVTYLVAGMGTERFSCESMWWVLALPLCLHRVVTREISATQASEVPATSRPLREAYDPLPLYGRLQYGP